MPEPPPAPASAASSLPASSASCSGHCSHQRVRPNDKDAELSTSPGDKFCVPA
jgi:hypothetical protein